MLNLLLEKNETFALSDEELGETDIVKHSMDTSGAKPVKEEARRLPYALRQQLEVELDKLLKIKCIEPANSPYASPIVLVRKPDGNLSLCGSVWIITVLIKILFQTDVHCHAQMS